ASMAKKCRIMHALKEISVWRKTGLTNFRACRQGPRLRALHRETRRSAAETIVACTEQAAEERERGRPLHAPGRMPRGLVVFDRDIGESALLAAKLREEARVAAVNVLADHQLAGIVHRGGLIGQVHRERLREGDVPLAGAEHPTDPLLAV